MNNIEDLEIINNVEKKYSQEIKDFQKFWYLGERFKYNSFVGYVNAPFSSKTFNISKLGFRGAEFTNKNLSNKKRVGVFGSSGLVGIPIINDHNNIVAYSNNYFKEKNYNFECLNFGVIAARIGNEMKLITKTLLEFELDYVVLMSGFNDASSYTLGSLWEYQDIDNIYNLGFESNKNLINPIFFLKRFWSSVKRKNEISKATTLAEKKFRGAEKYFRSKRAKNIDNKQIIPVFSQGEKIYLHCLNQIISACNYQKIPFFYIFQPSLINTSKKLSRYELAAFKKQNNFFGEVEEVKNYRMNEFKKFYDAFGRNCNNYIKKSGSKIINIEEVFNNISSAEDIFYDESHYFESGNKLIGETISKAIYEEFS